MRLRDFCRATTFMSLTVITSLANTLPPALINRMEINRTECEVDYLRVGEPVKSAPPLPSEFIAKDQVLEAVYYNTISILSTSNRCSEFFGGPAASVQVFNQLMGQVRKDSLSSTVAMRMHGATFNAEDARTGVRYRLFSKVSINTNGPFFKKKNFNSERSVFGVGSFGPNTREVRVLILLHELGHLMRGQDGTWLLPDDGGNEEISRNNSYKIEEVCGNQIKSLGTGEASKNLVMRSQPRERLALESSNPKSPIESAGNH
jgi:hypothetical protein